MVTGKRTEAVQTDIQSVRPLSSHLSIHLSEGAIAYLVTDVNTKKHVKKSRLEFDQDDLEGILKGLSSTESPFRSVSLTILPFERTIVPAGLYKEEKAKSYLDFQFDLEKDTAVAVDQLESIDSFLVYRSDVAIKALFASNFPIIRIQHGCSILLEALIRENKFEGGPSILIHLNERSIDILIVHSKRPVFFNNFKAENETDLVYHVLHTLELSKIDHSTANIALAGNTNRRSEEFNLLKSFCPDLRMAGFTDTLPGMKHLSSDELGRDLILMNQFQCG